VHLWQRDGEQKALTADRVYGGWNGGGALSPDGSTVAFSLGDGEYSEGTGYPQSRAAVLSVETRDVTVLSSDIPDANADHLQWSADGSEVAFIRWPRDDAREIVAVDVDDGDERTLLRLNDRQFGGFAWSSDGRELLVPTSSHGRGWIGPRDPEELWRYAIDTGDHEVIATPHDFILDIAWSPDDRLVALTGAIAGAEPRLYVVDLESGTSALVDRRSGWPVALTWSGPYLLYTFEVSRPDEALYLMRWDSRSKERARLDRPGLDDVLDPNASISASRCG
jgi:Tol biopolymer transport system component